MHAFKKINANKLNTNIVFRITNEQYHRPSNRRKVWGAGQQNTPSLEIMDKKNLGLYLIAASIIIASIIISQTIKSSRSSSCFDKVYEHLLKNEKNTDNLKSAVAANKLCNY